MVPASYSPPKWRCWVPKIVKNGVGEYCLRFRVHMMYVVGAIHIQTNLNDKKNFWALFGPSNNMLHLVLEDSPTFALFDHHVLP